MKMMLRTVRIRISLYLSCHRSVYLLGSSLESRVYNKEEESLLSHCRFAVESLVSLESSLTLSLSPSLVTLV